MAVPNIVSAVVYLELVTVYDDGSATKEQGPITRLIKNGDIDAASFSGTPLTATITFGVAFEDNGYSVILTAEASDSAAVVVLPAVFGKTGAGFSISLGVNAAGNLSKINWVAQTILLDV